MPQHPLQPSIPRRLSIVILELLRLTPQRNSSKVGVTTKPDNTKVKSKVLKMLKLN